MLTTELAGGFEEDVWFDSCVLHYGELCDVILSWIRVGERSYHHVPCRNTTVFILPCNIHQPIIIQWGERRGHIQ